MVINHLLTGMILQVGDILGFPNYFVVVSTRLVLNTELARDAGAPISVAGKQVDESAVSFRFKKVKHYIRFIYVNKLRKIKLEHSILI